MKDDWAAHRAWWSVEKPPECSLISLTLGYLLGMAEMMVIAAAGPMAIIYMWTLYHAQ